MPTMTSAEPTRKARYSREDFKDFARTGPDTLAGRFMRRFWHPVWVADELPRGRARSVKLMSEEFTLYRGESGALHAVSHRCPHRGTILSLGWVEQECIRCLYHGWKFDPSGQCVEQPAEGDGFASKVRIRTYPVEEYLGLIFVYLGEGEATRLPRFPQFEEDGVLFLEWYTRKCNYFQNLENGVDEAHVHFTHWPVQFGDKPYDEVIPRIEAEETEFGVAQYGIRKNGAKRVAHIVMPNMLYMLRPPRSNNATQWNKYISWRVPVDDEVHKSFLVELAHVTGKDAEEFKAKRKAVKERLANYPSVDEVSDAILTGDLTMAEVLDHPGIINIQDNLTQLGQGTVADHSSERLGRADAAVILLRNVWERELRALAEDRPLTNWKSPEHAKAESGA
jgi:5,5'-dehydrodivanillate O-demethylase oxygenase subunit